MPYHVVRLILFLIPFSHIVLSNLFTIDKPPLFLWRDETNGNAMYFTFILYMPQWAENGTNVSEIFLFRDVHMAGVIVSFHSASKH